MIHVLYVDDEPDLLDLGKIFLEQSGSVSVETAPSASRGLEMLEAYPYDAVVSDFQMPDMDGISFLKQIRSRYGDLPFILFTGKGREEVVIEALNNGADFYLQKGGDPKVQFIELHHKIVTSVKRKESEEKILFFNRIYAILSGVNAAILRIQSRDDLLREVCSIAIGHGKFSRAWIGMIDRRGEMLLPVACSGYKETCLAPVRLSSDVPSADEQASVLAAVEKRRVIQNDLPGQVLLPTGSRRRSATDYHSTAAFPIWSRNEVIATIQLYAPEPRFFGEDEVRLLEEVCADISYALDKIESSEQKRMTELALIESEEKFRILVEESLIGVYIIQDDRFLHVNPRFAEMFGYDRDEIISTLKVMDLVAPESRKMVMENLRLRISGDLNGLHYRFRGKRRNGSEIDVEVAGTRALFQGKPIIIGTMIDIEEPRHDDKNLILANRKLSNLNTLTRHDIANRLTVLRGRLKFIRKHFTDPDLLRQLAKVDDAGRDIYNYLETARIYQEIGMDSPRWQNVHDLIAQELARVDHPGISAVLNVGNLEILADPLCSRIFGNLVDNTLRHSDHATEIRVTCKKAGTGIVIVWEDNGIGIPASLKERVFEQGYGRNTGLGLFLCREIFLCTGISMRENGIPGSGVRFEITVPQIACRIPGEIPVGSSNRPSERSNSHS